MNGLSRSGFQNIEIVTADFTAAFNLKTVYFYMKGNQQGNTKLLADCFYFIYIMGRQIGFKAHYFVYNIMSKQTPDIYLKRVYSGSTFITHSYFHGVGKNIHNVHIRF